MCITNPTFFYQKVLSDFLRSYLVLWVYDNLVSTGLNLGYCSNSYNPVFSSWLLKFLTYVWNYLIIYYIQLQKFQLWYLDSLHISELAQQPTGLGTFIKPLAGKDVSWAQTEGPCVVSMWNSGLSCFCFPL